jgi:23S rRNA pseudouridine2605 synthase
VRVVYDYEKEYRVLVARHPDDEQLAVWRKGVVLEDGERTAPAEVRIERLSGKGAWLRVILREGRKRQIRETAARLSLPVVRIVRIRIGTLQLGGLKPREWRYLTADEVVALKGEPGKLRAIPKKAKYNPKQSGESSRSRQMPEKGRRR